MLDVRPTAYVVPLDEQTIGPITPVIHVENLADESANLTGLVRIYRESLGTLIYSSVLHPTYLAHDSSVDISAETEFNPGAPADDDYFILCEVTARSTLTGNSETVPLGQFYFDVKTAPMGPVPATHHTTHENGGMDEIDCTDLAGTGAAPHAASHQNGGADELEIADLSTAEMDDALILAPDGAGGVEFRAESGGGNIESLPTAEMDDTLVLAPDGAGGVEFRAEVGGITDHGALTGLGDDDHTQYRLRHEIFYETDFLSFEWPYFGSVPWREGGIAAGTLSSLDGLAAHPGIRRITSSTSANSGAVLLVYHNAIHLTGGETSLCWFRPQTLTGSSVQHGFLDALYGALPTDGAFLWHDPADGKIWGRTMSNDVGSTTGTGYQLVTDTWYCAKIIVNANATRVDFYLYSAAGAQLWTDNLTTNIPTAAGRNLGHGVSALNSGTTAVALVDLDYLRFLMPNSRPNV